ncbi:MAG TPA: proton-conducting transporter membrane subunit [Candidatus Deferrimicrobiaceae bacterium]|jgi:hydrogenase-4 component B
MAVIGDWLAPGVLLILASTLAALSGVPMAFRMTSPRTGQKVAAFMMGAAAAIGAGGSVSALLLRRTETFEFSWTLPFGPCEFGVDPLSALFLLPIFIVPACCAFYALDYRPADAYPRSAAKLTFFFGLLTSAMAWVAMARNGVLFLIAWEIMALAAWLVLSTEDEKEEVREASALYLITTHIGTLALFAFFPLLFQATGSYLFPAAGSVPADGVAPAWLFLAALFGFGMKMGMMPLHIWLPSAHASAPSHVSAVMSGVVLKVGVYGFVRAMSFFAGIPLWWGIAVLLLGIVSAVAGVAFAIGQHDLKRLLAYHSIENIGIILLGLGGSLIGRATHNGPLMVLGMAGALLHVLNHATFKGLLFLGAGSVIHAAGTREIDRMGGLSRRLPRTAILFLVGAAAICGLPPLNGFVSELLVYLGLFAGATGKHTSAAAFTALAVPSLALTGGLALACFVKVYGVVFLGTPRVALPEEAHGEGRWMVGAMSVLALVCVAIGLAPVLLGGLLDAAVAASVPSADAAGISPSGLAPLGWITALDLALAAGCVGATLLFLSRTKAAASPLAPTWGCAYLRPTPRIQYTASSFADMIVSLFRGILRPHRREPELGRLLPGAGRFEIHVPEAVLDLAYLPFLARANERLSVLRGLQHGRLHLYILYMVFTLAALLAWSM